VVINALFVLRTEREHASRNTIAVEQLFNDKEPLIRKSGAGCDKPVNPFVRQSCEQAVLNVYVGSGDLDKDKNEIRNQLIHNGWNAEQWKPEGSAYFWEKPMFTVKNALAEGRAVRNDGSQEGDVHTSHFKVVIFNKLDLESDAIKIGRYKMNLTPDETKKISDSNASYFIALSVDSQYEGSF